MKYESVDIVQKLEREKQLSRCEDLFLQEVQDVLEAAHINSSNDNKGGNNFNFEDLESSKIFHINTIKKICIDYRLRFLDLKYFKSNLPDEALAEIKQLEQTHKTHLEELKIMAPSKLFRLSNPDDPLLFVPLGNNYYYLVHKWGSDLSPLRKLVVFPFKSIENLLVSAIVSSLVLTILFNLGSIPGKLETGEFLLLFLFMFKSVVGIVIFYAISNGKNVNSAIWNSKYSR